MENNIKTRVSHITCARTGTSLEYTIDHHAAPQVMGYNRTKCSNRSVPVDAKTEPNETKQHR